MDSNPNEGSPPTVRQGDKIRILLADDTKATRNLYVGGTVESVTIDGREAQIDEVSSHLERLQRIDELFLSAAQHARQNAVGIILSGTLWDGAEGLKAIHEAGRKCIVQEPGEATFEDMPRNAKSLRSGAPRLNTPYVSSQAEYQLGTSGRSSIKLLAEQPHHPDGLQ